MTTSPTLAGIAAAETSTTTTVSGLEPLNIKPVAPGLEEGVAAFVQQKTELSAAAALADEREEKLRKMHLAAMSISKTILGLNRDQRNRLLLDEDIDRYTEHVKGCLDHGDGTHPLWKLTAARACGSKASQIHLRAIEMKAPVGGRIISIDDDKKVIELQPIDVSGEKPVVGKPRQLKSLGGTITVKVGDLVLEGDLLNTALDASHVITRGEGHDPLILGFANSGTPETVTQVLVEGKGRDGYFTLLAEGFSPRYKFGWSTRGLDRLSKLVGDSLALSAPVEPRMLRQAADAAFGPCPNVKKEKLEPKPEATVEVAVEATVEQQVDISEKARAKMRAAVEETLPQDEKLQDEKPIELAATPDKEGVESRSYKSRMIEEIRNSSGGALTQEGLRRKTGLVATTIRNTLATLLKDGEVVMLSGGKYGLPG